MKAKQSISEINRKSEKAADRQRCQPCGGLVTRGMSVQICTSSAATVEGPLNNIHLPSTTSSSSSSAALWQWTTLQCVDFLCVCVCVYVWQWISESWQKTLSGQIRNFFQRKTSAISPVLALPHLLGNTTFVLLELTPVSLLSHLYPRQQNRGVRSLAPPAAGRWEQRWVGGRSLTLQGNIPLVRPWVSFLPLTHSTTSSVSRLLHTPAPFIFLWSYYWWVLYWSIMLETARQIF